MPTSNMELLWKVCTSAFGRPPRVGYLVLDLPTEHLARRDRVGPVRELWMGETG